MTSGVRDNSRPMVSDSPLFLQWDGQKNLDLDPTKLTLGSGKYAWWRCLECSHSWRAIVNSRTGSLKRCPQCSHSHRAASWSELLKVEHPEIESLWNLGKNEVPFAVVRTASQKKYWWLCRNGHSYYKEPFRILMGRRCPYCETKHVHFLSGFNDLETLFPEISREWNTERNTLKPNQIKAWSSEKVWWRCAENHEWEATLYNRTKNASGCPECSRKTARGETELLEFVRNFHDAEFGNRRMIKPYELDVWIPSLRIGLEFNGYYWHSDEAIMSRYSKTAREYHQMKVNLARESEISLGFVWQDDWVLRPRETKTAIRKFLQTGVAPSILSVLTKPYDLSVVKKLNLNR